MTVVRRPRIKIKWSLYTANREEATRMRHGEEKNEELIWPGKVEKADGFDRQEAAFGDVVRRQRAFCL